MEPWLLAFFVIMVILLLLCFVVCVKATQNRAQEQKKDLDGAEELETARVETEESGFEQLGASVDRKELTAS